MTRRPATQIIAREMVEVAARRRTYAIRVAAVLLGLCAFFAAYRTLDQFDMSIQIWGLGFFQARMLGHGKDLVMPVLTVLTVSMAILLPTTAAMSVTREREQGTLVLLSLTPMGPTSLVLQKFLGQLLLAGTLAVLSLPLLAMGYSYGGVDRELMVRQTTFLAVLITQLAAIGLAAGCLIRGSIGAILGANAAVATLLLPFVLSNVANLPSWLHVSPAFLLAPPAPLPWGLQPPTPHLAPSDLVAPVALTLAMLLLARMTIASRLEPAQASLLGRVLRGVDAAYARIDARLFRRVQARELPSVRPVFWREANRSSFCNWRYLIRMLLPISGGLVFLMLSLTELRYAVTAELAVMLLFIAGGLVVALVFAGVISRERSDQTLDVLLSSGLTAEHILAEKTRALARLRWSIIACVVPGLWVCSSMPGNMAGNMDELLIRQGMPLCFPLMQVVEMAVAYGVASWLAVLIGLALRSYHRAAMISLVVVLVWMSGMHLLNDQLHLFNRPYYANNGWHQDVSHYVFLYAACSPFAVFFGHPTGIFSGLSRSDVLIAWSIDALIWLALRKISLTMARRWMSAASSVRTEEASA